MVKCVCGKSVEKIPGWLDSVQVDFVCNNCPKRQVKTIAQLQAEHTASAERVNNETTIDDLDDDEDLEEEV